MSNNQQFPKWVSEFNKFINNIQEKMPYNFNLLDEQCGHIVENSHTNILMKLLQYKNQGEYVFLKSFFNYIGWTIDIENNKDITFEREADYKKKGRIDGLIFQKNKFAVIIENKVNGAGNQEKQLAKYIEGVSGDRDIFNIDKSKSDMKEKVWVVFLTRDGVETPDPDSIEMMQNYGICNKSEEIEDPRYAAINYSDHILPWLKDDIQPCVMQKELSLNTGLLQYIDFLEGMLGLRKSETEIMDKYTNKVKKILFGENLTINEKYFTTIRDFNNNHLKKINTNDEAEYKNINILSNVLAKLFDEPMSDFYSITKEFFIKELKMKECIIHHPPFKYDYIQIRDSSWPSQVHFEWQPLGFKRLTEGLDVEYKFCFHVEKNFPELKKIIEEGNIIKEGSTKPILSMKDGELKEFLESVYKSIPQEYINTINSVVNP